ncbi:MAG: PAS domain S-box protein [Pseudomonadota bacterium]
MSKHRPSAPHAPAAAPPPLEDMTEGFALGEALFTAEGEIAGARLLDANAAFLAQTGLPGAAIGQPSRAWTGGQDSAWLKHCCEVAGSGQPRRFPYVNSATGRHYEGFCFSPLAGRFALFFHDVSARQCMEQALRDSEAYLRQMIDSLPNLVWTSDATGFTDYFSPQVLAYTGLSPERLQGSGWLAVVHPEDRDLALAAWNHAVTSGTAYEVNCRLRRHDGVYRWFSARATPIFDGDGRIRRWFGASTDIDDLKQSQEALRESEEHLRAAFEQAAVGMAYRTADGHWLRLNRKYLEMLGYSATELQGMTYQDISYPRELAQQRPQELRLKRGEIGSYTIEKRFRHKAGHPVWARVTVSAIRDAAGRHLYNFVIAEDIGARKELEAELERRVEQRTAELQAALKALGQSEARARLVLETTTDAHVAVDDRGGIVEWNRAAEKMFGWTRQEALGLTLVDTIVPPRFRAAHEAGFARFLQTGAAEVRGHAREFQARRRDGSEFPVEIALTANRIDDRWLVSSFMRDISERKQHEAALQEATRQAEAARRKAEAARAQAESANRAKSEFLATMSHEIRTPLNGVIGFTGLLLEGPLTDEKRPYAELARKSGESLLHLLNDFLDFSRIEAGRLQLEEFEFDPHQEIRHLMTLVQEEAQAKGLELSIDISAPDRVRGDVARLRQILLNLLSNAVKFTERGRVTLCGEEIVRTGDRVWLCFLVSDTGIGIDAETRQKLFQPFSQADASTTRKYGGTGLGLAISKRMAEAMGGGIGFRSQPGEGSVFWVKLPFGLPEADAGIVHSEPAPLEIAPASAEHRGRVLVVEDNPVSQLLTAEILRRLGCQADVAGNGQEAVEAWRQLPYDLVFMDCDMPVMNGFDATREIRAAEAADASAPHRHVPIIAMTASALQGDAEKCFAAGMDDFMAKPLRLQLIAKMVEKWLQRQEDGATG